MNHTAQCRFIWTLFCWAGASTLVSKAIALGGDEFRAHLGMFAEHELRRSLDRQPDIPWPLVAQSAREK